MRFCVAQPGCLTEFPSATGRKFLVGWGQRLNGISTPLADLWSAS